MLYLGMVAGIFVGAHVAQLSGLDSHRFVVATLILLVPTLVGARLMFVLTHWATFARDMRRLWRRSEGGMAMYGGIILAVPLSLPLLTAMELPVGKFWDAGTFTILLGMMFTRIGCLLNGCCAGKPSNGWYAVNLPDHRGIWRRRIPTQLLEMLWAAALLGGVTLIYNGEFIAGAVFCSALLVYAAGRCFLETLREHSTDRDATAMQITSAVLGIAAMIGLVLIWPH
jgi:phosphatidylglycerol:prolipoprotein diacylglycerol transferase